MAEVVVYRNLLMDVSVVDDGVCCFEAVLWRGEASRVYQPEGKDLIRAWEAQYWLLEVTLDLLKERILDWDDKVLFVEDVEVVAVAVAAADIAIEVAIEAVVDGVAVAAVLRDRIDTMVG